MKKIELNGNKYKLVKSQYANNGRLYLGLMRGTNLYSDITINLSDFDLEDDKHIFISGDLDEELFEGLQELGFLSEIVSIVQHNFGRYKLVMVDLDLVNEYAV